MKDLELICFTIISQVGEAKSQYLKSLQLTKKGKKEEAKEALQAGEAAFLLAHEEHAKLIQQEAMGCPVNVSLLLLHAEDQMMAAETVKILVDEITELHQKK